MKTISFYFFLQLSAVCSAQYATTGSDWTQAWVDKKILTKMELRQDVLKRLVKNSVTLVLLPKTEMRKMKNGNMFLKCFLVNNTPRSLEVARADATIQGFTTEIHKNGEWLTFQYDLGLITPSCGNSFWLQKLEPGKALSIECDHMETGELEVAFRLRYTAGNTVIYSNAIKVEIDEASYSAVPRRPRI
jgi:hypothetical protein